MSEFKGLGYNLTNDQLKVLSVFKEQTEIACPVGVGLSLDSTMKVLKELSKLDIITGRAPYRLTKLGKRLLTKV